MLCHNGNYNKVWVRVVTQPVLLTFQHPLGPRRGLERYGFRGTILVSLQSENDLTTLNSHLTFVTEPNKDFVYYIFIIY